MNIGKAIKLCRTSRKISQAELAKRVGCSISYLSMLENGKRDATLSTITEIAEALYIPVGILFFLAAERDELTGLDDKLAGDLSRVVLELLSASK